MRILYLDSEDPPLTVEYAKDYDFLVSHGYRHIIKPEILALFPDKAINLHIGYLPWNRGVDPNLWSFLDDTPKGVTIHHIDEGIDTGDIIYQEKVDMEFTYSLRTAYERLQDALEDLFYYKPNKDSIFNGTAPRTPQSGKGSYHCAKDKEQYQHLLTDGWDTKIRDLIK